MKSIIEPSILPGFLELLPAEQLVFNSFIDKISRSYERYGFLPIDTPILEKAEILTAKAGDETEKQMYTFKKGDHELAMRFDLTVPLARYVSQYTNSIVFPFKRYQIGKVYRGEKPQKGRFREFYQCDADIIAKDSLPIEYDAEMVALISTTFRSLDIGKFIIRISNRKILSGLLEEWHLSDKSSDILRIVDKIDKLSPDDFDNELNSLGLPPNKLTNLKEVLRINGPADLCLERLNTYNIGNSVFNQGLKELTDVVMNVKSLKVPESDWRIDLKIVRGLDYYTGTVYETILIDNPELGTVCGGGRYDDLATQYSKQRMPGVGISIGLTRLFHQLRDIGKIHNDASSSTKVLIIPMDKSVLSSANSLASVLRTADINTDVYVSDANFKKKLDYANKSKIPYIAILGDNEIKTESVSVKDMASGLQDLVTIRSILTYFLDK